MVEYQMINSNVTVLVCGLVLLGACADEVPPVSVVEFMNNPRLLEATMVRCAKNRAETKYAVECVNARDAVNRLAAAEEQARRQQMEAQSERKRQALRRTQEAAAEARRRAMEAQRQREEAEYLGLFDEIPGNELAENELPGQQPRQGQLLPQPQNQQQLSQQRSTPRDQGENFPPSAAGEDSVVTDELDADPAANDQIANDLQSIREELRRRREEQQQ